MRRVLDFHLSCGPVFRLSRGACFLHISPTTFLRLLTQQNYIYIERERGYARLREDMKFLSVYCLPREIFAILIRSYDFDFVHEGTYYLYNSSWWTGHDSAASPTSTIHVTQWSPVPPSNDPASEFTISTLTTESSSLATRNPTTAEPKPLPSHCEPLYLKACDNAGYKAVQFPNYFNQTYQNDAGVKIAKYWPLIEVKCSPLISLFLCSLYTPICTTTVTRNMLPCRSLCQQVTNDCSYFMKVYDGFGWPEGMTCEDFPDGDDGTCLNQKYLTSQGKNNFLTVFQGAL